MQNSYHTHIIRIGNSRGIRIPKEFMKMLGEKVIIEPVENGVIIRQDDGTAVPPRKDWESLFAKAIAAGEKPEKDIFKGMGNIKGDTEWEW